MELTKSAVSSFVSEYTRNICKCKISEEIKLYIFLYDITVQPYYSTHAILVEKWGILLRLAGMNKLLKKKFQGITGKSKKRFQKNTKFYII